MADGIELYLGDCREILPTLGKVDAVVTDPPYGHGRYDTDDSSAVLPALVGYIGTVPAAVFGYPEALVALCRELQATPIEWVTWWPSNSNGAARSNLLPRTSEHIAIFASDIDTRHILRPRSQDNFGRSITVSRGLDPDFCRDGDVWRDASPGVRSNSHMRHHINEKPVSVMEKLISCWSAEIVLDPFMGSGTTGIAALKLGRKFIGIEIEPKYFEIARKRIQAALDAPDMFVEAPPPATQEAFQL